MNKTENTSVQPVEQLRELRKQIARLQNTETRYKKLIDQSRDGIVILDSRGKVYEANRKFADMLGFTLEETHSLHVWDWDKNLPKETILELAGSIDEKGHHFETRHTRQDGSVFDVELSNSGTFVGGEKLIFCICRDITERKRNEAQLRESRELFSTFIENFQGIAYQVPTNEIALFTPRLFGGALEQITGYPVDAFTKENSFNMVVHPDDIDRLQAIRGKFVDFPGYASDVEYRIIRKDGALRWLKESARIVKIGIHDLVHGTIFDITQRKSAEDDKLRLEEQIRHSEKLKAIGTLAGGVAHDFNNILGIIMGYAELALAAIPAESRTHEYLTHITKAGNRAKDIIHQLLTFSRKVSTKKLPISVVPVIKETLIFLRSTLPATIELQNNLDTGSTMILADPTQMHQVIMNLCVNAAQAIGQKVGKISVTATTEYIETFTAEPFRDLPKGVYVRITTCDTGPGMPPEIVDRIFDPYFTTREKSTGSGLGLAVVHGIIENHGGAITVTSIPGQGTTFTIVIPAVQGQKEEVGGQTEPAPTGNESILFVDDEPDIVTIGKLLLEEQGFRVQTAVNPLDALDLFRKNPHDFDVIVTDMTMPHLTGDALFREVRKIRSDIPVILCTGYSRHIDEEQALELGLSAFILKPLSGPMLACAIRKVLDEN